MATPAVAVKAARSVGATAGAVLVLALLLASPVAYTLLVATSAVLGLRWLARRVDAEWKSQQLHVSWRPHRAAFTDAHSRVSQASAAATAASPGAPRLWESRPRGGGATAWQDVATASPATAAAAEALVDCLVRDFITDLWYKNLTPDTQFPGEVQAVVLALLAALAPRLQRLNLGALLVRDTCDVLAEQLELYRRAVDSIGADVLASLPADARDRAFASELACEGDLLYAASSADAEQSALRRIGDAMCGLLMPQPERECGVLRALTRELVAGCVLRPVVGFAAPFWTNKLVLAAVQSRKQGPRGDGGQRSGEPGAGSLPHSHSEEMLLRLTNDAHGLWNSGLSMDELAAPAGRPTGAVPPPQQRRLAPLLDDDAEEDDADEVGLGGGGDGSGMPGAQHAQAAPTRRAHSQPGAQPAAVAPPLLAPVGSRPLRAAGGLTARVTGSCVVHTSSDGAWTGGGGSHVSYDIQVTSVGGPSSPPSTWLIHRRFSQFERLHKRVKALRARGRYKLPPKRLLFHGTEGVFMDARRQLLDQYLVDMLADPRLAASPEVGDFLAQHSRGYADGRGGASAAASVAPPGVGWPDDVDARSDEGSRASVSEAAASGEVYSGGGGQGGEDDWSSTLSEPVAQPPGRHGRHVAHDAAAVRDDVGGGPAGGGSSGADPSGLSLPILDLVDCIFRLRARGLVRRRMLSFARGLVDLLVGSAVDEALASQLGGLRSDATCASLVQHITHSLWPTGVWHRTKAAAEAAAQGRPPPAVGPPGFGGVPLGREAEAAADVAAVRALLLGASGQGGHLGLGGTASAAERLIGSDAFGRGCSEVFGMLQSPLFVRQIGHSLLEAVLAAAMPEMHAVLWEVRTTGAGHHGGREGPAHGRHDLWREA